MIDWTTIYAFGFQTSLGFPQTFFPFVCVLVGCAIAVILSISEWAVHRWFMRSSNVEWNPFENTFVVQVFQGIVFYLSCRLTHFAQPNWSQTNVVQIFVYMQIYLYAFPHVFCITLGTFLAEQDQRLLIRLSGCSSVNYCISLSKREKQMNRYAHTCILTVCIEKNAHMWRYSYDGAETWPYA